VFHTVTVPGDRNGTDPPQPSLVGLVTAGAGVVGYVYAMGAASLYLELWTAGLPKGEALDQFTSRRFVLIGVVVAAAAAILTLLLSLAIRRLAHPPKAGSEAKVLPPRHAAWIFQRKAIWQRSLALGAIATLVAWLVVNTLIIHLSLRIASVQTPSGCVSGIYISSDAEGVHLADGVSDSLLVIPTSEVRAVSIGVKRAVSGQSIRRCNATEQAATDLRVLLTRTTTGG
jgi:hypothetical protein